MSFKYKHSVPFIHFSFVKTFFQVVMMKQQGSLAVFKNIIETLKLKIRTCTKRKSINE